MNDIAQESYRDGLDYHHKNFLEDYEDVKYSLKKLDFGLFSCYSPLAFPKKMKPSEIMMWITFGKEKTNDAIAQLKSLIEVMEEIEEEINRDEINNAE